jgi:hypothetical protein
MRTLRDLCTKTLVQYGGGAGSVFTVMLDNSCFKQHPLQLARMALDVLAKNQSGLKHEDCERVCLYLVLRAGTLVQPTCSMWRTLGHMNMKSETGYTQMPAASGVALRKSCRHMCISMCQQLQTYRKVAFFQNPARRQLHTDIAVQYRQRAATRRVRFHMRHCITVVCTDTKAIDIWTRK